MIRGIVFDFDGTLIDTESAWYAAFCDLYQQHRVELPLSLYAQCIGTSHDAFDPVAHLMAATKAPITRSEIEQFIQRRHGELMRDRDLRPGVKKTIQTARKQGLRIGLATSSHRVWIDPYLERLGIADAFDCIRTADDVKRVKPDPALYELTLACLGLRPDEAVAIEDSPNGALAAVRA
ncbi:haloacid dehalogenase [Alicyclobacillus sacchari]|nr:HAD-IA family hydrolase [Alicyclobacillus sacchari]GMA56730.1 haloacid dehalogenase [Alicyclobacillus sacchari]